MGKGWIDKSNTRIALKKMGGGNAFTSYPLHMHYDTMVCQ